MSSKIYVISKYVQVKLLDRKEIWPFPLPLIMNTFLHHCYIVMSPCALFTKIRFASLDSVQPPNSNLTRVKLSKN